MTCRLNVTGDSVCTINKLGFLFGLVFVFLCLLLFCFLFFLVFFIVFVFFFLGGGGEGVMTKWLCLVSSNYESNVDSRLDTHPGVTSSLPMARGFSVQFVLFVPAFLQQ